MDISEVHQKQIKFFESNSTKSISFRIEQLRKLKSLLQENEKLMYEAIYKDFGKSEFDTFVTEMSLIYHELNLFIRKTKRWSKRKSTKTGLAHFPSRSFIIPEPLGVCLVIGAWNYPYQLSLLPAITALAAGNTVILKPSELPIRTSSIMSKIINENFDMDYFHVIEGGVDETKELLQYRFDKIFFTGSISVGKLVYKAAAEQLTPVVLELGGKSPALVLADCDMKMTVRRLVWAKFLNAGQTCVAPDYVLVDKKIEKQFLDALKKEIEKYYSQDNKLRENYTQIINQKNFDRLIELIDPKKVIIGGESFRQERVICPTVMSQVSDKDKIMQDEIFGPILPVISFEKLEEAIQLVKERPKPLSCYVYSKNKIWIDKILFELSFGGGAINDSVVQLANSHLPFGGVGFSGIGAYHGKTGFDAFTHYKSVMHKSFWFEASLKYYPYSNLKLKIIKWLLS